MTCSSLATRVLVALLLAGSLAGCPRGRKKAVATQPPPIGARSPAAGAGFVDWYPDDISLPGGVSYPCEVTALPRELDGIPEADRGYVNHACAVLIGLMRDKQVLYTAMANNQETGAKLEAHQAASDQAHARLSAEEVPAGLEGFHSAVLEAITLQRAFFARAEPLRAAGGSMEEVHALPEGHDASGKLVAAWGVIAAKYPGWSPAVKDSVYHHLCGLDLF